VTHVYICDAIRRPIGRFAGSLSSVRADDLAAVPIRSLLERNSTVDWEALDDVFYGCANQAGEDNRNVLFERLERTLDAVLDQVDVRAAVA
jgi:acetyl-CoA acetyltransferase